MGCGPFPRVAFGPDCSVTGTSFSDSASESELYRISSNAFPDDVFFVYLSAKSIDSLR